MIALFFFTWMYIISTTNWELSDYMCELIYLKTCLLGYKNCRGALFLTFLLFPYLILKLLTIVQKVKMSNIAFFFFKDLSVFIYPYTELLYSVSQNIRYHLLCIFMMIYIVLKMTTVIQTIQLEEKLVILLCTTKRYKRTLDDAYRKFSLFFVIFPCK